MAKDLLYLIAELTIAAITIIPLFISPQEKSPQAIILMGIIIGLGAISIIFTSLFSNWSKMRKDINTNNTNISLLADQIKEIKKSVLLKERFDTMDVRLKVLERLVFKNKKSQSIDPRIIILIIMIILLIIYLRLIGVIK